MTPQCTPVNPGSEVISRLAGYRVDTSRGKIYSKGAEVGSLGSDGYYRLSVTREGRQIPVRRCHIVFWSFHDRWPESEIDHWNRIKTDDSISNLRESTRSENQANRFDRELPPGVHLHGWKSKPYEVQYKRKYLGAYPTVEEASEVYLNARKENP
jgi:hypothetical protein